MSYFEDASLVMIPSGIKDQKVYSIKPTDGSGDLTFTRTGDTATRVASNGLIERVRTNTYLYSNTFTDAAWTNLRMNFTAAAAANPLTGTSDAFKAIPDTDSGIHAIRQSIVYGVLSIYAKKGENEKIGFRDDGDTGFYATFNLNTGVLIEKSASALASITALSGGWYRVQFAVPTSSSKLAGIYFLDNAYTSGSPVSNVYAGNGTDGLFIYASQAETGDIATDYIATTSAAVSVGPVANLPRLDYSGGATCPSLLLEPQRTNLAKFSEQLDNAAWIKNDVTITANGTISPDGTTNADIIVEGNGVATQHRLQQGSLSASAGIHTLSAYVKNINGTRKAYIDGGTWGCFFDFSTLAVQTVGTGTATATAVGNGWYRLVMTGTTSYTPTSIFIGLATTNETYTGDGTSSIAFWGAQFELGAYASSYINTLGAAVTRGADSAYKTGISSLFGTNQGTFLMDFVYSDKSIVYGQFLFDVTDSTNYYRLLMYSEGGGTTYDEYSLYDSDGGVVATYNLYQNTRYKIGVKYNSTAIYWYINGSLVGTGGAFGYQMAQIYLAQRYSLAENVAINLNQTLVFPTALTNAQLAELTTI
jgi:hypothetical protein